MKIKVISSFILLQAFYATGIWAQTATVTPVPTVKESENSQRADELWQRGDVLARKGLEKKALEYFNAAKSLDPSVDARNHEEMPEATNGGKQNGFALDYEVDPSDANTILIKTNFDDAALAYRNGKYQQALDNINLALVQDQEDQQCLKLKAMILSKMPNSHSVTITTGGESLSEKETDQDNQEAKPKKTRHTKKSQVVKATPIPTSDNDGAAKADTAYYMGSQSYSNGDLVEAKNMFLEAIRDNPADTRAQIALNHLYLDHPDMKDK